MLLIALLAAKLAFGAPVFGGFINPDGNKDMNDVVSFEQQINHKLDLDHTFVQFGWDPNGDMVARWQQDVSGNRIPEITWSVSKYNGGCASPSEIMSGVYYSQLASQATAIAALGAPVLISFFHEFNIQNRAEVQCFFANSTDPQGDYKNVYRYVTNVFTQNGATNVTWVFTPGVGLYADSGWQDWFPGSDVTGIIGADYYNSGVTVKNFGSSPSFTGFCHAGTATGLPMMIAETGATPTDPEYNWIDTLHTFLKTGGSTASTGGSGLGNCRNLKYVLWFDAIGDAQDYRFDSTGLSKWSQMVNDPVLQ